MNKTKLDISKIEFSKNDIKRGIKLPDKLTIDLAHLIGIHLGDGCLVNRKHGNRISYNGHFINEHIWYENYLSPLILKLFNLDIKPRKGHNSVEITLHSKARYNFLDKVCGLPSGSKENCNIPKIILNGNIQIKKIFLRGLADTDFSLVFKNRHKNINYYPVINYESPNENIHVFCKHTLESLGFNLYSNNRNRFRNNKKLHSFYFQINGVIAFRKWMDEIGFTNDNQLTKIKVWEKYGFLPAKTNINDRIAILNGKKEIMYFQNKIRLEPDSNSPVKAINQDFW